VIAMAPISIVKILARMPPPRHATVIVFHRDLAISSGLMAMTMTVLLVRVCHKKQVDELVNVLNGELNKETVTFAEHPRSEAEWDKVTVTFDEKPDVRLFVAKFAYNKLTFK